MGTLKLWWETLADIARTAPREHLEMLAQDVRFALRLMRKNLGFTTVAVLTLALGIGANTAIFSVVNSILLNPLPYEEPDRIVMIGNRIGSEPPPYWVSFPQFTDLQDQNRAFEEIAMYGGVSLSFSGVEADPERISAAEVSAGFFDVLRVRPVLGRTFLPEEDHPGNNRLVILSYSLWQQRFGGAGDVVGKTIHILGQNHVVVGIMPPRFAFPSEEINAWIPLGPSLPYKEARGLHRFQVIARVKSDVSLEQARANVGSISLRLLETYPDHYPKDLNWSLGVASLPDVIVGRVRPALLVLLGAVGFVLLISCVNVANLLLTRASAREKEIAIRAALGAGRSRLVRQLLTESIALAALGGVAGLLVAYWGLGTLVTLIPYQVPRLEEVGIDGVVLGFTLGLSVLTGMVFGLIPAHQVAGRDIHEALKEGGRSSSAAGRHRARNLLAVVEIALAVVLLVGAGLMVRSFLRLQQVDSGFRSERVLTTRLTLSKSRYETASQKNTFYQQLLSRIESLPGVLSAAAISTPPLYGGWSWGWVPEGFTPRKRSEVPDSQFRVVSPGYFQTMNISLLRGRDFSDADDGEGQPVVIISRWLARKYWPEEDPVGKRLRLLGEKGDDYWRTIVGVVGDVRHWGPSREVAPLLYVPHLQAADFALGSMTVLVRTAGDPTGMMGTIRSQVLAIDPQQPVFNIRTMDQFVSDSVAQPRFHFLLLGLFAVLALVLAAVGVYGVISYSVGQRTHEFGVRMALGAQRADILKLVVGQGMLLTLIGVAVGLAGAFALTRFLQSLLFGVAPTDPATFAAVAVLLGVVALLACYIPARRATKVDPMVALRYE